MAVYGTDVYESIIQSHNNLTNHAVLSPSMKWFNKATLAIVTAKSSANMSVSPTDGVTKDAWKVVPVGSRSAAAWECVTVCRLNFLGFVR